jgi:hypothetical protein
MSDDLTTLADFDESPQGRYKYWLTELDASKKARKGWLKQSDNINDRFLGKKTQKVAKGREFDLNLFHSNVKTLSDMMYGNVPKIDVSRRYAQSKDDVGRVASEVMERLLNLDAANNSQDFDAVMRSCLQDRLLSGLGCAKARYEFDSEDVPTGMIDPATGEEMMETRVTAERAPTDYFYWGDIRWSWCRNWADMRWLGFRSYMTQDEVRARWGDEAAEGLTYKKQTADSSEDDSNTDDENTSAWERAEIWEIWNKADRTVHWLSYGYDKQLEEKPDPLQLSNFWPCPPFLIANVTTKLYEPVPDFVMAQDLYNEVDKLQTRIATITEAVRVVGVYNQQSAEIGQMLNTNKDNTLIPVSNWALFGENGGLTEAISWLPLQDIMVALDKLTEIRDQTIGLLQQITGMTDVMQGSLSNQYEGVGQSKMKAKFGSVRIQSLQEQFAVFASNLMQIKGEIIARHFSPETIFEYSNMEYSEDDPELVAAAIELIKNPAKARLQIVIRPESIAMVDYSEMKQERTEYMNAISTFMQSASPLMESDPAAKPLLMELLQWGLAGFKGSSEIEGVIDRAIAASAEAEKAKEGQEQPSEAQIEAQAAQQMEQMKQQGAMQAIQAKTQSTIAIRDADKQADIETEFQRHQMKMAQIQGDLEANVTETQVKLQADLLLEQAQAASNIQQTQATVEGEIQKDVVEHEINMVAEQAKTQLKIGEIMSSASAKIAEAKAKPQPTTTKAKDDG